MTSQNKIVSLNALLRKIRTLKKQGKRIAFTNGCFDILHFGHLSYLEAAKKNNRILVIGLNSDRSVKKIKGPGRPIVAQQHRAALLAGLACVDYVTIFPEETPLKLIKALQPDILIKGADWKGKEVVGADEVKTNGGKVEFIRYLDGFSTSRIIDAIAQTCKK